MQGRDPPKPNNLLVFLRTVARNAQNVILGTATPIQLDAVELWDLLSALNQGRRKFSARHLTAANGRGRSRSGFSPANGLGRRTTPTAGACSAIRCRLPPSMRCFATSATTHGWSPRRCSARALTNLGPDVRRDFLQEFRTLAERHNPIVRRVVRRTRPMLEERGLLKRIGVIAHPRAGDGLPSASV